GYDTPTPPIGAGVWDVNILNRRESRAGNFNGAPHPVMGAITSRSYHVGGVNALMGDGSVHFISSSIDGMMWRGMGSIAGDEIVKW
ncbi:MAG: H-X9-DG-CTERM domain-containing protein, partial [Planctomycetia bacterium]